MKHKLSITLVLVLIFLMSQLVGMLVLDRSIDREVTLATGNLTYQDLPYNLERPPVEEQNSYIYIITAILVGTVIVLLLMRFRKPRVWKFWYLFSVIITLSISFNAFTGTGIALAAAIILAILKVYRPNAYLHNATEIFVYSGIAVLLVPILNLFSAFMLLILISIYDAYAVWKSKHMVKLANFQRESKVFAGLSIPYKATAMRGNVRKGQATSAILGGGDMAFPLLFTGVLMPIYGWFPTILVPIFSAGALLILLLKSEKGKFYPAMPFISAGCFIGYGLMLLF